MSKNVSLRRESILQALHHLELLVPSLDRIGSHYAQRSADDLHRALGQFCLDWEIFRRLSEVRKMLSETLDDDELEKLFGDLPTWSPNERKPPPGV